MAFPRAGLATLALALAAFVGVLPAGPTPRAEAASATYALNYAKLGNGKVVPQRWNPCQTITYKVNLVGVPVAARSAYLSETHAAMRALAYRTGFTFAYKGATAEVPRKANASKLSAEIVIAYTGPKGTDYDLSGAVAGFGGFTSYSWSASSSGGTTYGAAIVRGFVVIDTPQVISSFAPGFGSGLRRGNLLLHELGHVAGLRHVSATDQILYPSLSARSPNGFQAGDRYGLARIGRNAGCVSVPSWVVTDLS